MTCPICHKPVKDHYPAEARVCYLIWLSLFRPYDDPGASPGFRAWTTARA